MYTLINAQQAGMRFFRSQDAGASWLEIHFFPASIETSFNNLAIDPADPQVVYASGGTSLQRSVDRGETWETLAAPGYVFTAASSELLYAAGGTDYCGPGRVSSLARSEDGGQTWQTFPLGCLMEVEQIAVLPAQPDVVYLSVLHYAAPSSTLLKSMDGGQTWASFPMPDDLPAVFQLLVDPDNPQRLFASIPYGIIASLNGGETWQWISSEWMGGIFHLALSGGSLYAVDKIYDSKTSLYRTDDGGETWWSSLSLLPEGAQTLQADPAQADRLWAGLIGYGIFLTNNGGGNWTERNSGINSQALIKTLAVAPSDRNVIYAAVDDPFPGVYRSQDGGQTWGPLLSGFEESTQFAGKGFRLVSPDSPETASAWYPILKINKLLVHPLHPEIAWAATSNGIFETLDGNHWQGTLGGPTNDLAVSPLAPDEPYAALGGPPEGIVVRRTFDPVALRWYWTGRGVDYRLMSANALRVDPDNPQWIILSGDINTAAGRVTSFFQSQDGGMTSRLISQIEIDAYGDLYDPYDMAIAPTNSRHIIVTLADFPLNNGKFYRSNDGGATWLDETSGLPVAEGQVWPVVIDGFESTYLGTANGVFRQAFSQTNWQPIGLQGHEIRAMSYYSAQAPSLFAAGGDGSAWRLDLPPVQKIWLPLVEGGNQ
jgi:photosystem II stability/assembly factor-like uncharacterized protein